MATDEEYLDNLLKSMSMPDDEQSGGADEYAGQGEDGIFREASEIADPEMKEEALSTDSDDWKASLDDILSQADVQVEEEPEDEMGFSDFSNEDLDSMNMGEMDVADLLNDIESIDTTDLMDNMDEADMADNMDVTDLIDNMDSADADLAEINGLLKKADQNEGVNDDILELLESVDTESDYGKEDSDFDIFSEDDLKEVSEIDRGLGESEEETEEKPKKKKRAKKEKSKKEKPPRKSKGKKKKLFGKKKKPEDDTDLPEDEDEAQPDEDNADSRSGRAMMEDEESETKGRKEKKPGFFSKIVNLLTEEDDLETALDDNAESGSGNLKELDEEDRKKLKKEATKKSKEKTKAKKKAPARKKAPKAKKKKEKPAREVAQEGPVQILNAKTTVLLAALCVTLIASILIVSTFLPEYADKNSAIEAYRDRDYETVYRLFYNKRLSSDEQIMFDRASTVLKLERKWQSYENNMALNKELEALDALMQGVKCYQSMAGTEVFGAGEELDALYQQICSVLSQYGITPEEAAQINACDNVTYTRRLDAAVNGTEYTAPGEEKALEEPLPPQDILPEEEEFIDN